MNIIDTPVFKVSVFVFCIVAYAALGQCDALAGETEPPKANIFKESEHVLPQQVNMQRKLTPERSLVYHSFRCGNYDTPTWSVLMRINGDYINGPPNVIRATSGFVALIYQERPVEIFHYELCLDHGDHQ